MEESKSMNIYNLIILDESGSMESIYAQALSGINETLSGIRRTQEDYPQQNHFVSIVTFEGSGMKGVKTRRDRVPVSKIDKLTEKDYRPGGCTPLYDAMGSAISALEGHVTDGDGVLVTVITDGYENASEEYSGKAVKEMVERMRGKGWTFAYIGANQDAVEVARELSIPNALNFDATPEGTVCMSVKYEKARKKFAREISLHSEAVAHTMERLFEDEEQ